MIENAWYKVLFISVSNGTANAGVIQWFLQIKWGLYATDWLVSIDSAQCA